MGNLRDQLRKANLISKKDAKRLAHEERVDHKLGGGAKGAEQRSAAREAELRALQEEQRQATRQTQAELDASREAAAEEAACLGLLQNETERPRGRGAGRWYFRLDDGRLPCLEIDLPRRLMLHEGQLCVVQLGPKGCHDYALLAAEHARRVARVMPDSVVWAAAGVLD